jgi:hypothetical protein
MTASTAKIAFAATLADGTVVTRTSGTMPYVAITDGDTLIWHQSLAAAHKAATSRQQTWKSGVPAKVIPVTMTAIIGKMNNWAPEVNGWGEIPAEAFTELVAAKRAPVVDADAEVARKAKAAADRRRQRAAKKAREEATEVAPLVSVEAAVDAEIERRVAAKAKEAYEATNGTPEVKLHRDQRVIDGGRIVWRNTKTYKDWVAAQAS